MHLWWLSMVLNHLHARVRLFLFTLGTLGALSSFSVCPPNSGAVEEGIDQGCEGSLVREYKMGRGWWAGITLSCQINNRKSFMTQFSNNYNYKKIPQLTIV